MAEEEEPVQDLVVEEVEGHHPSWGVEVVDDTVEDKTTRTKNLDRRSREPKVLRSNGNISPP